MFLAGAIAGLGGAICHRQHGMVFGNRPLSAGGDPVRDLDRAGDRIAGSEPAQPRALVGGHLVATLVGFAGVVAGRAAGLGGRAGVASPSLRCISPEHFTRRRASNPLLVVSNNLPWSFLARAGAGRHAAAGRLCLWLAPMGQPQGHGRGAFI